MEGNKELYEELTARAKNLWRENKVSEAAETNILAASHARSPTERAQSFLSAANNYGLAGNDSRRTETAMAAIPLWMEAADSETETQIKLDLAWKAVLSAVATRDQKQQIYTVTKLAKLALGGLSIDDCEIAIGHYLRQFRSSSTEARNILTEALASTYMAKADTQRGRKRIGTLQEAAARFIEASNLARHKEAISAISETESTIAMNRYNKGAALEKSVGRLPFREDKARAYEAAASAYAGYWDKKSRRCLARAEALRTKAAIEAESTLGLQEAQRKLQEILDDPSICDLKITADGDAVVIADTSGLFRELNSRDQFIQSLAASIGISPGDRLALELFRSALLSTSEWDSYQPFPNQMPMEVTKTRWRRTVLAVILAALVGGGGGAAKGWEGVTAGVVGAEAGLSINLLSEYMSRSKSREKEFWGQLEKYSTEPRKMLILAHLKNRSMTAEEISRALNCSPSTARRILNDLSVDDAIESQRGVRGAWVWSLKEK